MKQWRYGLVAVGVLGLLYGAVRLVVEETGALPGLALWMVGIVIIHDGLLSPLVVAVGWLLARTVPPVGRRYLQVALVIGGLITVIAIPLIALEGTQPTQKALLIQNYGANLAILLGLVAALNLAAYLVTVARDRHANASTSPDREGTPSP